jgi:hypothetical protein
MHPFLILALVSVYVTGCRSDFLPGYQAFDQTPKVNKTNVSSMTSKVSPLESSIVKATVPKTKMSAIVNADDAGTCTDECCNGKKE